MTLSDGDVAALARQAVDLLDSSIEIAIEPGDPVDPYRFGQQAWVVWPLLDGRRSFGIRLQSASTPAGALAQLIDGLSEDAGESTRFWGRPFPACAGGHRHPARVETEGMEVAFRCPETGEVVGRVRPEQP